MEEEKRPVGRPPSGGLKRNVFISVGFSKSEYEYIWLKCQISKIKIGKLIRDSVVIPDHEAWLGPMRKSCKAIMRKKLPGENGINHDGDNV